MALLIAPLLWCALAAGQASPLATYDGVFAFVIADQRDGMLWDAKPTALAADSVVRYVQINGAVVEPLTAIIETHLTKVVNGATHDQARGVSGNGVNYAFLRDERGWTFAGRIEGAAWQALNHRREVAILAYWNMGARDKIQRIYHLANGNFVLAAERRVEIDEVGMIVAETLADGTSRRFETPEGLWQPWP